MKKDFRKRLSLMALLIGMLLVCQQTNAQTLNLPYFCGFEDSVENAQWVLNAGPAGTRATNKWYVSDADVYEGDSAMIISNTQGATATYGNTSVAIVAYRTMTLPAGTYELSFMYKAGGENNVDGLYACWVDSSITTNSSQMNPPVWVNSTALTINGTKMQFRTGGWRYAIDTITSQGSLMKLVFVWVNNGSNCAPPGGCIDNIEIRPTGCDKPTNLTATANGADVTVTWTGTAPSYDLKYLSNKNRHATTVTGITTNTYTVQGLSEGLYDFMVRSNCTSDTSSSFTITQNITILDPTAHCINYYDLNAPGVVCTYGTYENPKLDTGVVDSGYAAMSSRHTIHYVQETDPRTGNGLTTIPQDEVVSVRLGNWNINSEAETITYTYEVPTDSNTLIVIKHATVFEEPGHETPPEFNIQFNDTTGQLLDSCLYTVVMCDGTLTDATWHTNSYESSTIWWREWTTVGFDLTDYAGQTIQICLTTKDCGWNGHYGYTYFTLSCDKAGLQCKYNQQNDTYEYTAPDHYNYLWTNNCTGQPVAFGLRNKRTFAIASTDTCSYTCTCTSRMNSSCSFSYTVSGSPYKPESSFGYEITRSDCQNHIEFTNNSQVYQVKGGTKQYLPGESIEAQHWSVQTEHTDRPYYGMESDDETLGQITVPSEGDTLSITLTTRYGYFDHDTTLTIVVPRMSDVADTISMDTTITKGSSVHIAVPLAGDPTVLVIDTTITTSGNYTFYAQSTAGCDSLVLYVKVTVQEGTGVDAIDEAGFEVSIAPNPISVGETLRITTDGDVAYVEVYDFVGRCVKRVDSCDSEIDIEDMNAAGVYVVKVVSTNGNMVTRRVVVE